MKSIDFHLNPIDWKIWAPIIVVASMVILFLIFTIAIILRKLCQKSNSKLNQQNQYIDDLQAENVQQHQQDGLQQQQQQQQMSNTAIDQNNNWQMKRKSSNKGIIRNERFNHHLELYKSVDITPNITNNNINRSESFLIPRPKLFENKTTKQISAISLPPPDYNDDADEYDDEINNNLNNSNFYNHNLKSQYQYNHHPPKQIHHYKPYSYIYPNNPLSLQNNRKVLSQATSASRF